MHYAVWLFMHNSLRPSYRIKFRYALSPIMHYDCMHYELFDCTATSNLDDDSNEGDDGDDGDEIKPTE